MTNKEKYVKTLKKALQEAQEAYKESGQEADFDVMQEYERRWKEELETSSCSSVSHPNQVQDNG